jgi:hypothetical protein
MVSVLIYCPPLPSPLLSRHPCESRGPVRVWPAIPKVCVFPTTAKPCVLPATHAASVRSAGPLRPNERRAYPTAPFASSLDSCLRRNDGGNRALCTRRADVSVRGDLIDRLENLSSLAEVNHEQGCSCHLEDQPERHFPHAPSFITAIVFPV